MNDDYLLDEEDEFDPGGGLYDDVESDTEEDFNEEDYLEEGLPTHTSDRITESETWLSNAYDDIVNVAKSGKDDSIRDAAIVIVNANPKHTSSITISHVLKELFQAQGHNRMVNSLYTPDSPMSRKDVSIDYLEQDDADWNNSYSKLARELITGFIGQLAARDYSKDSNTAKRERRRHLPAFIIFLFSAGLYDYVLNCPTMPKVYDDQINRAFRKLMESKFDVVEQLALKYEEAGRHEVADKVRELQFDWFEREPGEIRGIAGFNDLELTYKDVLIYREVRSKWTNLSKSITQEVVADLIEVETDQSAVFEKLKDKTRTKAIAEAKLAFQEWVKESGANEEIASRIVFKNLED